MLALITVVASLLVGQVADTSELTAARAQQLVQQLSADDVQAQRQAEEELIAAGTVTLEHLPAIGPDTPEQLRIRLLRIREAVVSEPPTSERQPQRFSLVGEMTAAEAIAKLKQQAGLTSTSDDSYESELPEGTFRFDVQDKPFWEVAEELLSKTNLALSPYSGDSRIFALVPDQRPDGPATGQVCLDGPFRFEASRLEAVRDLRNPDDQILRLIVMVFWEPGMTPVTVQHDYASSKVVAGEQKLAMIENMAAVEHPVRESIASIDLEFPFELPGRDVQKIDRLTGTITAVIPGKRHTFEFNDLASLPISKQAAGVTVVMQRARTVDNLQDVRLRIKLTEVSDDMKTHMNWIYNNVAYLKSASGERIDEILMEVYQEDEGELGILYKYDAPGEITDYQFVYETPSGLTSITAQYDLKDIELP